MLYHMLIQKATPSNAPILLYDIVCLSKNGYGLETFSGEEPVLLYAYSKSKTSFKMLQHVSNETLLAAMFYTEAISNELKFNIRLPSSLVHSY